jgi:membrane protein involved in colicin uptake
MENPKMPLIKIHNAATGEEIEREMNAKELEQWEKDQASAAAQAQAKAEAAAKKAAAEAKLALLGLDADDLRALGL